LKAGVPGRAASWQYAWRGWILGALLAAVAYARWHSTAPLQPVWLALVALGLAYRWQAGRHIPGHSNGLDLSGSTLAAGGPYRFGRHPLYLSNLAVIAGLILFAHCLPAWGAALCLALAAAHHALLARAEERFLAAARGEAYLRYMQVTPRWLGLPRSRPLAVGSAPEGGGPAAEGSVTEDRHEPGAEGLAAGWRRQGANIAKACACALALWLLAAGSR
jgi:protein-S-isoprenylcysteine O-methyltransferase Ste14